MSTFTVGIPTFNRPSFLKASLSSALAQQFPRTQITFRTSHLKSKMERWKFDCPIHLERIILADACVGRKIAIQPKIGAFHRYHASKYYESLLRPGAEARQWRLLLEFIGDLLKESRTDWQSEYRAFLKRAPLTYRTKCLNQSYAWPDQAHWLSSFVIKCLNDAIPGKKSATNYLLRRVIRNVCPPVILKSVRRLAL